MTEDEAKTKWCPFARMHWKGTAVNCADDHALGLSNNPTEFFRANCVGSDCMAWRTMETTDQRVQTDKGETVSRVAAQRFGWTIVQSGYCGLAGATQ